MQAASPYWIGRLALAGLAMLIGAAAIWMGLAQWWLVLALGLVAAAAGAMIVRDPPGMRGQAEAHAPGTGAVAGEGADTGINLLELIEHPLLVIDEKKKVELANGLARDLLGEHIVGQDIRLALRSPAVAALLADGAPPGTRVELFDIGGENQRWELLADPRNGRQVVRLIDRTALQAAERMRVDFVANASHELRTPLATLIGFIETLEGPAAEDESARKRFLGIMRSEAQRMIRLVDDLMSLSRIESDKHRAPTEPVDLVPLVEEVRATLGRKLADGGRRLVIDAAPSLPPVAGDRDQLLQLFYNLINNAIKYGFSNTPITVRIMPDGRSMLRLSVEDEGEGIAPEHLPRLTERFYRVDAGRSRSIGGTGLGLAIVKHIVERHRGQLSISSDTGVGTRVTALLPAAGVSARPGALSR